MFTSPPARALAALALLGSLSLTACDSTEPDDGAGEEELITQVTLTLTPQGGGSAVTIAASDPDGDGAGLTFSPSTLTLTPGTTYDGSIELRDTINGEDITEEVEEESEEHLFRYTLTPASAGTVTITDTESDYTSDDENGGDFAVGLSFQVVTAAGASGTGTMNAVLYHFDEGPKTSSAATSDEIDVDIAFPVTFAGAARASR
jgi:hypothetical protein